MLTDSETTGENEFDRRSANKATELDVPSWLRNLVPGEIQLSATATAAGRLRLLLDFPKGPEIAVEFVPRNEVDRGFAFVGPDFAIMYLNTGNASPKQRASVCQLLGNRLQPEAPAVLQLLEDAKTRIANDETRFQEQARRTIVDCLRTGQDKRAKEVLDQLVPNAQGRTIPFVASAFFALNEPLRAKETIKPLSPDCPRVASLLVNGLTSSLLGQRQSFRSVYDDLMDAAENHPRSLDLLRFAGVLAQEAGFDDLASAAFEKLAKGSDQLSDALPMLQILANKAPSSFADNVNRLLAAANAVSEISQLGSLCETAGRYDLAAECHELCLEREAVGSEDEKATRLARLALARLATWRLDLVSARKHLDAVPRSEREASRLVGIIQYLEGSPTATLETFDELQAKWPDERDLELELWRAEALLSLERLDEAKEAVARAFAIGNSFAGFIVKERRELAALRQRGLKPSFRAIEPEFREFLKPAVSPADLKEAEQDLKRREELLEDITRSFGGSRARPPIRLAGTETEKSKLERWELAPSSREAATKVQEGLRTKTPSEVLHEFDLLAERFPQSPFPFTYRGEVHLWLGDYDAAFAAFEEALRRRPARWAYIGMAAGHLLLGETQKASELTKMGIREFGHLAGATTHVYRGELHRRQGDFKAAFDDLEIALRERPTRIASRMNLALTCAGLGMRERADAELQRAVQEGPGAFWLALDALGMEAPQKWEIDSARPVIEKALELMRGNRSSWLYSMFDAKGHFRVLPKANPFGELGKKALPLIEAIS